MNASDRDPALRPAAHPGRFLCWTFRRGGAFLTCELDITGENSYEFWLLPHWDLESAEMEHFNDAGRALARHTQVAEQLSEGGWAFSGYCRAAA